MSEEWRPVVGWEGLYSVSDVGRVRSEERIVQTSAGSRRYQERIRKFSRQSSGHLAVSLRKPGVMEMRLVHRLVLTAFVGPCPAGMEALHANDIASDNRLVNLRWGTRSDNLNDMVRNGRHGGRNKTHCPRGHELSGDNLVPSKLKIGIRQCLTCSLEQGREWGRNNREQQARNSRRWRLKQRENRRT